MNERLEQLPPRHYSMLFSKFLAGYHRSFDHPFKLRLLTILEYLAGQKRIVAKTKNDFYMGLDRADLIQRSILYDGVYEPELTSFFTKELNENDVFYDIGANVGYYSCLALSRRVKHVVAFDPDPLNCGVMRLNLSLNDFDNIRLTVIQSGVGNGHEIRSFHRAHVANTGVSGFGECNAVANFDVEIDSLDSLINSKLLPVPTVIKIDVEGWEEDVLSGAKGLFAANPPRVIIFETDCNSRGEVINSNIPMLLHEQGYVVQLLSRETGEIQEKENYVARLTGTVR